jgi:hypothetical protein
MEIQVEGGSKEGSELTAETKATGLGEDRTKGDCESLPMVANGIGGKAVVPEWVGEEDIVEEKRKRRRSGSDGGGVWNVNTTRENRTDFQARMEGQGYTVRFLDDVDVGVGVDEHPVLEGEEGKEEKEEGSDEGTEEETEKEVGEGREKKGKKKRVISKKKKEKKTKMVRSLREEDRETGREKAKRQELRVEKMKKIPRKLDKETERERLVTEEKRQDERRKTLERYEAHREDDWMHRQEMMRAESETAKFDRWSLDAAGRRQVIDKMYEGTEGEVKERIERRLMRESANNRHSDDLDGAARDWGGWFDSEKEKEEVWQTAWIEERRLRGEEARARGQRPEMAPRLGQDQDFNGLRRRERQRAERLDLRTAAAVKRGKIKRSREEYEWRRKDGESVRDHVERRRRLRENLQHPCESERHDATLLNVEVRLLASAKSVLASIRQLAVERKRRVEGLLKESRPSEKNVRKTLFLQCLEEDAKLEMDEYEAMIVMVEDAETRRYKKKLRFDTVTAERRHRRGD